MRNNIVLRPGDVSRGRRRFARDEYSRNVDKTVTLANGQSVRVEHRMGNVDLHTHAGRDVVVHAIIRVSASKDTDAKRLADQIQIEVAPAGSTLVIRTEYPREERDNSAEIRRYIYY